MPGSDSDPEVSFHRVPTGSRIRMRVVAALFALLAVISLLVPFLFLGSITALYIAAPALVVYGLLANRSLRRAARSRHEYRVDAVGIIRRTPKGAKTPLRWTDVGAVRLRRMPTRLVLLDENAKDSFQLDSKLTGFAELVTYAAAKVYEAQAPEALEDRVYRHGRFRWLLIATAPLWALLSMAWYGGVLFIAWVIAAVQLAAWGLGWRELRIEGSSLVVTWPFRSRQIAAGDVMAVALVRDEGGTRLDRDVAVLLGDRSVLTFGGVRGGELPLFAHLSKLVSLHSAEVDAARMELRP